jgi:hypothetical protein
MPDQEIEQVPTRVLEAEQRREFRELLKRSSVGAPVPDPLDPAFLAEVFACADAIQADMADYFQLEA